ncbi:MAG: hydroxyethylthiazole kinase [Verrucomicrobia bacterium]|nr:hydroxyethylthiazole kinase [Verrucomicrobiota bacterium]
MESHLEISPGSVWEDLQKISAKSPLIHNITNTVVQNFTANALLALGASPIMSDAMEELGELIKVADAVNLNIGTPSGIIPEALVFAARSARDLGKPVALDPVAMGATVFRRKLIDRLRDTAAPTVIRGNVSEISALKNLAWSGKGVDATGSVENAPELVRSVAKETGVIIASTGAIDFVSDGIDVFTVANGHQLMSRVTGTGCVATAFIAAFLAVQPTALVATLHALVVMGIAGELAAEDPTTKGPGSFYVNFLDSFDRLSLDILESRMKANANTRN